jgi:hypothetical protein
MAAPRLPPRRAAALAAQARRRGRARAAVQLSARAAGVYVREPSRLTAKPKPGRDSRVAYVGVRDCEVGRGRREEGCRVASQKPKICRLGLLSGPRSSSEGTIKQA